MKEDVLKNEIKKVNWSMSPYLFKIANMFVSYKNKEIDLMKCRTVFDDKITYLRGMSKQIWEVNPDTVISISEITITNWK